MHYSYNKTSKHIESILTCVRTRGKKQQKKEDKVLTFTFIQVNLNFERPQKEKSNGVF